MNVIDRPRYWLRWITDDLPQVDSDVIYGLDRPNARTILDAFLLARKIGY